MSNTTNEEIIVAYRDINIASIATTIPALMLWLWVFQRIVKLRNRSTFVWLIMICSLMVVGMIASMIYFQLLYTYTRE